MYRISPLRALISGLVAGAAGSAVQSLFFRATARIAPPQPESAFAPPEPEQEGELPTATVARRFVEGFMAGELDDDAKHRSANLVHFAYGSLWGGLYGIIGETFPAVRSPLGMLAYGSAVYGLSDDVILPAFKLSAWPGAYPVKSHLYWWAAHVAYGAGLWGSYEAMRFAPWGTAMKYVAVRGALSQAQKRLTGRARAMRPRARKVARPIREMIQSL